MKLAELNIDIILWFELQLIYCYCDCKLIFESTSFESQRWRSRWEGWVAGRGISWCSASAKRDNERRKKRKWCHIFLYYCRATAKCCEIAIIESDLLANDKLIYETFTSYWFLIGLLLLVLYIKFWYRIWFCVRIYKFLKTNMWSVLCVRIIDFAITTVVYEWWIRVIWMFTICDAILASLLRFWFHTLIV